MPTAASTPPPTLTPVPTLTPGQHPTKTPKTPEPPRSGGKAPSPNTLSVLSGTPTYRWHYEYDKLSRVVYACSDWDGSTCVGDEFHFSYDGAGNLTRFDKWDGSAVATVLQTHNGANQLTSSCLDTNNDGNCNGPVTSYTYDAYGNLTDDGVSTYAYDAENRLISTSAGGVSSSYTYNGDGDRISQNVDGTLTTYILDVATPLTMVLSETNTSNGSTIHYWQGLDVLAQSDGTNTKFFEYDGLGSVRQLTSNRLSRC